MKECKICGLTVHKLICTEQANCLNISLEEERQAMSNWNKCRANNEAKGLKKYYSLKETFKKSLVILVLIISSYKSNSQMLIGMGGAISDKQQPFFQTQLGVTFGNKIYEDNEKREKANSIYTLISAGYNSQMIAFHFGRNVGAFQPFLGGSFHLTNIDAKKHIEAGFKPDYGLSYFVNDMPLCLSLGRSGNTILLSILIYTVK